MKKIMVLLLAIVALSAIQVDKSYAFSDVKKDAYYKEAVEWAVEQKVLSGYPDNTFKPNRKVTFNQFIKMYTNSFDFKKNNATTYDDFYKVLEGYNLEFDWYTTNGEISRGDVSVLLAYAAGKIPNYEPYDDLSLHYKKGADYMLATKLSSGQSAGKDAIKIYGSHNTLTRAQAVSFLYRASQMQLTTIAPEIRYFAEPPLMTDYSNVLRSYDMGDGIVYHVMNHENPTTNYEVLVTVDGAVLGGYAAVPGVNAFGYMIGERYEEDFESPYYTVEPHIDRHNNDEVRAVSYRYKNAAYYDVSSNAMQLKNTAAIDNVSQLYTDLANEFRVKNGVGPLQSHTVLTKAAKGHSVDMAVRNYFSHTSPEGQSPGDRIKNVAAIPNLFGWGENISAGNSSVFHSHTAWINSSGHRSNLLHPTFTHIGYGVGFSAESDYRMYYTTKFGTIRGY